MKLNKIKSYIEREWLIWIICAIYTIIGIFLMQNEVPMDHWFIEASADGLFGNANRSLWVLCSNYIITGSIWILSKTGLRLFWLDLLLVFLSFVSNLLVCKIIKDLCCRYAVIVMCVYLTITTPFLFYILNFTICAAYFITCGLVWICHCIECQKEVISYIPGYICFIYGFSLRWDCVVFGGLFLVFLLLSYFLEAIKKKKTIIFFRRYVPPFLIVFIFFISITGSYIWGLNNFEKDFSSWNSVRTQVDDYDVPSYEEADKEYAEIGVSKNDYNLLRAWNNYDSTNFSKDLYLKMIQIKKHYSLKDNENSLGKLLMAVFYNFFDNSITIIGILFLAIAVFSKNRKTVYFMIGILLGYLFLIAYFLIIGRLIYRIEYSLILSFAVFCMYIVVKENLFSFLRKKGYVYYTVALICSGCILTLGINPTSGTGMYNTLGGKSVYGLYEYLIKKDDIFGKYLFNKCFAKEKVYKSVTLNYDATEMILDNKKNFYLEVFCDCWKQSYPLTDMDIFRTGSLGIASNMGVMGQYYPRLKVMQNNYKEYGIDGKNPYKQLTDENVYVLIRDSELYDRSKEITTYAQEHYDESIQVSVVDKIDDVAILKYESPINTQKALHMTLQNSSIEYNIESDCWGFAKLDVTADDIGIYDSTWLQITDKNGNIICLKMGENEKGYYTYLYNDLLQLDDEYSVELIVMQDGKLKKSTIKDKWRIKN